MKKSLKQKIIESFDPNNKRLRIEEDEFSDGSCNWLNIKKQTKDYEITVVLSFSKDRNTILDVEVFKNKIITIVDEEHGEKII